MIAGERVNIERFCFLDTVVKQCVAYSRIVIGCWYSREKKRPWVGFQDFCCSMAIEKSFEDLCQQVFTQGLKAALVTDKDGVVILKCSSAIAFRTKNIHSIDPFYACRHFLWCPRDCGRPFHTHHVCCSQQPGMWHNRNLVLLAREE